MYGSRAIGRTRHWTQTFDPNAKFIWAKSILYGGGKTVAGYSIPKSLAENVTKLRRFWHSRVILLKGPRQKSKSPPLGQKKKRRRRIYQIGGKYVPEGTVVLGIDDVYDIVNIKREISLTVTGKSELLDIVERIENGNWG